MYSTIKKEKANFKQTFGYNENSMVSRIAQVITAETIYGNLKSDLNLLGHLFSVRTNGLRVPAINTMTESFSPEEYRD